MQKINFRIAELNDVAAIITLLADDVLGSTRENPTLLPAYINAFKNIQQNPNAELWIAECKQQIVGVAQVDYITYLTYQGGMRAQIEGVRVHKDFRNLGIGRQLIEKIIVQARIRRCHMVQLTTNKSRQEALSFYEAIGFKATHEGLKLML